tara:strand:- start:4673 stop:5785 length:1113 start_codon:yes stop_codon:yes gene_type:complete
MASSAAEYGSFGAAADAILTQRQWSDDLHFQVQNKLFFNQKGFIGPDKGGEDGLEDSVAWYPIVEKYDLDKNQGDSVRVGLLRQLSTSLFATGNTALEGTTNIQKMDFDGFLVWVELARTGTGWQSKVSQQRNRFHTKGNAGRLLANVMAQYMDDSCFNAFYNGYSGHIVTEISGASNTVHPNQMYAGTATTEDELDQADVFNTELLERMGTWLEENNINPILMENGETGYSIIIHPRQLHTLRADDRWHNSMAEAQPQNGWENPIFSRATGIYNGISIHVSNKIASGTQNESVRRAILMGAHSVGRAVAQLPELIPSDSTDFHRVHEWAIDSIFGDSRADYDQDTSDDSANPNFNQSSSVWDTWAAPVN